VRHRLEHQIHSFLQLSQRQQQQARQAGKDHVKHGVSANPSIELCSADEIEPVSADTVQ
jgi:hypothetical protein